MHRPELHSGALQFPTSTLKLLDPLGARVYVHCTAGINRGPTLAAAYLIKNKGLSAREAYEYVIERRQCRPYPTVLQEYAKSLAEE